jgi:predicted negative regulator of RcsB-dependent stress response
MDTYRTEEEQVEAIGRWWNENGRSIIISVVLALSAGFGWQAWKDHDLQQSESASHEYQLLLQHLAVSNSAPGGDYSEAKALAEQIKAQYSSSGYAQFAALQLAKIAVSSNDLEQAKTQLKWALSKAPAKSDIADIASLRLARVLASSGDTDQALDILEKGRGGAYAASYELARGDIYMELGRTEEAKAAYLQAKSILAATGVEGSLATLEQKLQTLTPIPARTLDTSTSVDEAQVLGNPESVDATAEQEG